MNTVFQLCFQDSAQPLEESYVEVSIGGVHREHRKVIPIGTMLHNPPDYTNVANAYFGPAVRSGTGVALGKKGVLCSHVVWTDIDHMDAPIPVLPPSYIVKSGHGWHYYWRLSEWCYDLVRIETVNSMLADALNGDSAHNCDRLLRIPGSLNAKETPVVLCEEVDYNTSEYTLADLEASTKIGPKIAAKIATGDMRGFGGKSRSERDWAIVEALLSVSMSEDAIRVIFQYHDCGDKYRESDAGDAYLEHTIERAQQSISKRRTANEFAEVDNCYFAVTAKGAKIQVSTFIIQPEMLLEGDQDSIMGTVCVSGTDHVWRNVIIPRSAFTSVHTLVQYLPRASWVWLGQDRHVRQLLAHLVQRLQELDVPRAHAVTSLGRHKLTDDDRTFFVTTDCVIASDGSVTNNPLESPIVYVEQDREVPRIAVYRPQDPDADYFARIADLLPRINDAQVIWPILGWFMATPYKTLFEAAGFRFPILNVVGTRGSGKSTLILRVFQPLLGYEQERSYDSNTTRFVILTLLGFSNSVPVSFSEFRAASTADFTRYVLLSYDTGHDPRGRADLTTTDFPLSAPFSLDGEDMLEDPATKERIIAAQLAPTNIIEGCDAWDAFQQLQLEDLGMFARPYLAHTLTVDIDKLLARAEEEVFAAFPQTLPHRIRKNLIVAWSGVLSWASFMKKHGVNVLQDQGVTAEVLAASLELVYSTKLGRAPMAADEFSEVIINAAAKGLESFPWTFERETSTLWFQLSPAFEYYLTVKARQRQVTLTRAAIRSQLEELAEEYTLMPQTMYIKNRKILAYGISLTRAYESGLDVPSTFNTKTFTVSF